MINNEFVSFPLQSFGIKMDNFSLRSSQTEKFVKASQVEMLFDENLILKQQVTICSI